MLKMFFLFFSYLFEIIFFFIVCQFPDIKDSTQLQWWPRFICKNFSTEILNPSLKDTDENLFRKLRSGGAGLLIWLGSRASAGSRSHFFIFWLYIFFIYLHVTFCILYFCSLQIQIRQKSEGPRRVLQLLEAIFWLKIWILPWNIQMKTSSSNRGQRGPLQLPGAIFASSSPLQFSSPLLFDLFARRLFFILLFFPLYLFACLMYSTNFLQLAFSSPPLLPSPDYLMHSAKTPSRPHQVAVLTHSQSAKDQVWRQKC